MRKTIIIIFILLLAGCSKNMGADLLSEKDIEEKDINIIDKTGIEESLKIKTDKKDKVISSELKGNIKYYDYISEIDVDVAEKEIDGKKIKENINKRTTNKRFFDIDDDNYIVRVASGRSYYQIDGEWKVVNYATTTLEAYNIQMDVPLSRQQSKIPLLVKNVYADTLSPYTEAGDGFVSCNNSSWATLMSCTSGDLAYYVVSSDSQSVSRQYYNGKYYVHRGFFPFDTSGLSGEPTNADLNLYVVSKTNNKNDGYDYVTVVQTSQASESSLAVTDFDNVGSTEGIDSGEREDISSLSTGGYLTFTLNSTGLGWIDDDGITYLGLREGGDLQNQAPSASNGINTIGVYYVEQTGTANDPYLEITYTSGASDSCTPDGGDHTFLYSDNCYLTSDTYVSGKCDFFKDGAGSFGIADTGGLECEEVGNIDIGFNIGIEFGGTFPFGF